MTFREDWPRIAFEFHPSVELLDLARGTAEVFGSLANENEPPAIQHGEEAIVFWREVGQSSYRLVAEDERLALMEARQGKKFSDICALLSFQATDQQPRESSRVSSLNGSDMGSSRDSRLRINRKAPPGFEFGELRPPVIGLCAAITGGTR